MSWKNIGKGISWSVRGGFIAFSFIMNFYASLHMIYGLFEGNIVRLMLGSLLFSSGLMMIDTMRRAHDYKTNLQDIDWVSKTREVIERVTGEQSEPTCKRDEEG